MASSVVAEEVFPVEFVSDRPSTSSTAPFLFFLLAIEANGAVAVVVVVDDDDDDDDAFESAPEPLPISASSETPLLFNSYRSETTTTSGVTVAEKRRVCL